MIVKITTNILIFSLLTPGIIQLSNGEPVIQEENLEGRKTIDQLLRELKIERNRIEQQRLEEIRLKKLEEERLREEKSKDIKGIPPQETKKENKSKEGEKVVIPDDIPKLIVRLRGKHANKYLCRYDFLKKEDNVEKKLQRELLSDYSKLLRRSSLKVRPGEKINFELTNSPKNIKVTMVDGESRKVLNTTRNTIEVPDLDKKVVLEIHGEFTDGYIDYAVVLDIRHPK